MWRTRAYSVVGRLAATLGILAYTVIYITAVVLILHHFFGLTYEFRGGYIPRLTFRRTAPDYEALEKNRAQHAARGTATQTAEPSTMHRLTNSFWNGFRGLHRDGLSPETNIRTNWPSNGLEPMWRQPCGGGYASFAMAGDVAFTIEQRRADEAIVAYQIETGRELWVHPWPAAFSEPLGGDGPRATPAFDEGRVYGLGALGEFRCLEAVSGKLIWRKNIVTDNQASQLTYGMAASPLIVGTNVIVTPGGHAGKCVIACDKTTGQNIWHALDDGAAYSSPMLVQLAGAKQLLVVTKHRAVGLDPGSGKLLWEFPWVVLHGNRNIAQPIVVGDNRVFLSAGYGTGCALIDVTNTNGSFVVREVWRNTNLKNKFTSSVLWQGHIYGLDEDILTCIDAATGNRKWKSGRYGYGQLILARAQLIILTGTGEIAVVAASADAHQELTRFPAVHGKTWNHPALDAGRLLVRNSAEMACFNVSAR